MSNGDNDAESEIGESPHWKYVYEFEISMTYLVFGRGHGQTSTKEIFELKGQIDVAELEEIASPEVEEEEEEEEEEEGEQIDGISSEVEILKKSRLTRYRCVVPLKGTFEKQANQMGFATRTFLKVESIDHVELRMEVEFQILTRMKTSSSEGEEGGRGSDPIYIEPDPPPSSPTSVMKAQVKWLNPTRPNQIDLVYLNEHFAVEVGLPCFEAGMKCFGACVTKCQFSNSVLGEIDFLLKQFDSKSLSPPEERESHSDADADADERQMPGVIWGTFPSPAENFFNVIGLDPVDLSVVARSAARFKKFSNSQSSIASFYDPSSGESLFAVGEWDGIRLLSLQTGRVAGKSRSTIEFAEGEEYPWYVPRQCPVWTTERSVFVGPQSDPTEIPFALALPSNVRRGQGIELWRLTEGMQIVQVYFAENDKTHFGEVLALDPQGMVGNVLVGTTSAGFVGGWGFETGRLLRKLPRPGGEQRGAITRIPMLGEPSFAT